MVNLLDEIEIKKEARIAKLQKSMKQCSYKSVINSYFGTMYLSNGKSYLECYTYIDPKMSISEDSVVYIQQLVIQIYFIKLHHSDKRHFSRWDDFTMYNTSNFHKNLVDPLLKRGFKCYILE